MAQHQSAEDVEKEHLEAFGPTLGPLYHALQTELTWLHAKWLEHRKLYAHSEKRIDLLNETAAYFFRIVQDVLWQDVLLHITRLTAPPRQGHFENLTIRRLPEAVAATKLARDLRGLIEDAQERSVFAREWRNRSLAHQELSLALDGRAQPLPGASRQKIEEALESLRKVMNRVYSSYLPGEIVYTDVLTHDDASDLVHSLAVARWYESRQLERFQRGETLPEDFEGPPEV